MRADIWEIQSDGTIKMFWTDNNGGESLSDLKIALIFLLSLLAKWPLVAKSTGTQIILTGEKSNYGPGNGWPTRVSRPFFNNGRDG